MKGNGLMMHVMEKASRDGLTIVYMMENGKMEKQMAKANCIMLMEIFTKGIGKTIKLMGTGLIHMQMAQNTLDSGKMINNTG
jgi:hypothetical protein